MLVLTIIVNFIHSKSAKRLKAQHHASQRWISHGEMVCGAIVDGRLAADPVLQGAVYDGAIGATAQRSQVQRGLDNA